MNILKSKKSNGDQLPAEVQQYAPKPRRPFGEEVGDAITQYCQQAADAVKVANDEIQEMAASFAVETEAIRNNLLTLGDLERERTQHFYSTLRDAVRTIMAIKSTFAERFEQKPLQQQIDETGTSAVDAAVSPVKE